MFEIFMTLVLIALAGIAGLFGAGSIMALMHKYL